MKRIDELLFELNNKIRINYNIKDPLIKITLTHEAFDKMLIEMSSINRYESSFSPAWMNDFKIFGVRVEARKRK